MSSAAFRMIKAQVAAKSVVTGFCMRPRGAVC
jgi:hypothetical protein